MQIGIAQMPGSTFEGVKTLNKNAALETLEMTTSKNLP